MRFHVEHGDSTERSSWERSMRALGVDRAQAMITDPPYCLLTRRRKGGDLRDSKDRKIDRGPVRRFEDVREFKTFTRAWLELGVRFIDPNAPLVIWTNLLGRAPIIDVARALGWSHLRGEFVWGKRTREGNSGEEILRVVETALVFSQTPSPEPHPADAAVPWSVVAGYDDDGEASRWGNHPNHKPWGVVEALVRTWSKPGDVVVDPFAGSGSIPAGALTLGRRCACIELEAPWATRVRERLSEFAP